MSSLVFLDVNVSVNVYGKNLNYFFDFLYNYLLYSQVAICQMIKFINIVQLVFRFYEKVN